MRPCFSRSTVPAFVLLLGWTTLPSVVVADPINFNRDIRPILSENCFYCHGQDANKRAADLRLDLKESAVEHGAIVPGNLAESELVARIRTDDPATLMPPPKSNRHLTDQQKALLEQWIESGANYESHWAFVTPQRPQPPEVAQRDWPRNDIDRFILAKLEQTGLNPSPEADKATLIKRLYSDLIGLPPTPAEVDEFVASTDPLAYEKLVDRLLANPHYGERMALPWLDSARYADSNGFQQDGDTWQWYWRDWVVRAFNSDLPFDQFTIWQLAGDLLPDATTDQKIASGFNRNHLLNGEGGAIAEEQRFVILFDRIDTTATTWLGLTMACAQCHDHKYDPVTQKDYYSLMDAFNRVPESGVPSFFSSKVRVAPPIIELPTEENQKRFAEYDEKIRAADAEANPLLNAAFDGWRAGTLTDPKTIEAAALPANIKALLDKPEAERTAEEKAAVEAGLRKQFDEKIRPKVKDRLPAVAKADALRAELNAYRADNLPRIMVMSDAQPRKTSILDRGEYLQPRDPVEFNTPAFLPPLPADAPKNRLGLARWLVSPEHPLTARVQVNRMWQTFFGAGLVKTVEDFGVQSEYPIHGPLLDWLAVEFREKGWSLKQMHRLIVTSATYRQSSKVTPDHKAKDPENRLYARASRFRMPSLILRDWALAASGLLDPRLGGKPVYPYQPDGVWESLAITKERDFTYPTSSGTDLYRRSLYTFWRRTVGPSNMFDTSNRQACRVRASQTSTPLHALTTLNDPTWVEAARVLAETSTKTSADPVERLRFAFRQVLGRAPRDNELAVLNRALQKQTEFLAKDAAAAKTLLTTGAAPRDESLDPLQQAALTSVCLAIMNLDEALTRE